jgi:hypothetical protein
MRRGLLTGTLSLLSCLNCLSSTWSMPLHSCFWNSCILYLFCSNVLILLVLFFQIIWIIVFTRPNPWHVRFIFSIFSMSYQFSLSFNVQNLLFVTVAILSHYQSPVNCSSRNLEGNFTHKVNYHYHCHFPGLVFVKLAESIEGLPSQWRDFCILKIVNFHENYIWTDDWQCCYIGGRCSYMLNWTRKRNMPYRELVGATYCITLSHKPRSVVTEFCCIKHSH